MGDEGLSSASTSYIRHLEPFLFGCGTMEIQYHYASPYHTFSKHSMYNLHTIPMGILSARAQRPDSPPRTPFHLPSTCPSPSVHVNTHSTPCQPHFMYKTTAISLPPSPPYKKYQTLALLGAIVLLKFLFSSVSSILPGKIPLSLSPPKNIFPY